MAETGRSGVKTTVLVLLLMAAFLVGADLSGKSKPSPTKQSLAAYLEQVRQSVPPAASSGSLWSPGGRFANLATDYRASQTSDLIVIKIVEETSAVSDGAVKSQRSFSASSGISGLLGQTGTTSGLRSIFSPTSSQTLDGQAQASTTSRTTASLAGYVKEALPNGCLLIEATRELETNNQRQTLVVRGIVRPGDVAADNSVLSTSISHLELELNGKGVISDGVHPPNRILRAILRVVGF